MPGTKFDYVSPLFNLEIKVIYPERQLQDNPRGFSYANGLFSGKKHITEKGYIRSGHIQGLEHKTATLNFENNLIALDNIVNMREEGEVFIFYDDGIDRIRIDNNGLYIVSYD